VITLSCCSIARREEPVETVIDRFAEIGWDAIEFIEQHIDDLPDSRLRELRDRCLDHPILPLVLSPYLCFARDEETSQQSMEKAKRFVHYAEVLGAPKMRVFTSTGMKAGSGSAVSEAQWAMGVQNLRDLCALDRGLNFVLETHPMQLPDTPDNAERLLREVDAPNCKLLYQPMTGAFLGEGVAECFLRFGSFIDHIHLHQVRGADPHVWVEEPGDIDMAAFLDVLNEEGYEHSLSLEYCWGGIPWERVESGFRFLADLLGRPV